MYYTASNIQSTQFQVASHPLLKIVGTQGLRFWPRFCAPNLSALKSSKVLRQIDRLEHLSDAGVKLPFRLFPCDARTIVAIKSCTISFQILFLVTITQTLSAVFLQAGAVSTHWSNDLMTLYTFFFKLVRHQSMTKNSDLMPPWNPDSLFSQNICWIDVICGFDNAPTFLAWMFQQWPNCISSLIAKLIFVQVPKANVDTTRRQ